MAPLFPREKQASPSESHAAFAQQVRLSRVHTRLVPMQRNGVDFSIDPAALTWFELPPERGFAGYGLGRALGLLLDAMRGLSALNETTTESGEPFTHGEFTPLQFRVDPLGVCRLVPLTTRHYVSEDEPPARAALGFLSPERLIGEKVGLRGDVFSAGVLLWEALAGRRLLSTESPDLIIDRLMSQRLRAPTLPPELAWATPLKAEVERALSINQQRRFANCAEFSEVILRIAQDRVASHEEIAAFFASNFKTTPSSPPRSEPGSARSPDSFSRDRPIANPGATFRMLPAVSTAAPGSNTVSHGDAPPRHATLKMNVTLKMAQVPLPISNHAPEADAAQLPQSSPPKLTTPSLSAPMRRTSAPPLASLLLAPPRSPSPPPRSVSPPPRSASPPPLRPTLVPLRNSSPPPLPSLARTAPPLQTASSSPRPLRSSTPPPLPPLTSLASAPPPSTVETTRDFELSIESRPASSPPDLASNTPVPTQISLMHPTSVASLPPTTLDPAAQLPRASRRRRVFSTIAVGAALVLGVFAAATLMASRWLRSSSDSERSTGPRSGAASVNGVAQGAVPSNRTTPSAPPSTAPPVIVDAVTQGAASPNAEPMAPNADRAPEPRARPPLTRPGLSGNLPAGKDYGI